MLVTDAGCVTVAKQIFTGLAIAAEFYWTECFCYEQCCAATTACAVCNSYEQCATMSMPLRDCHMLVMNIAGTRQLCE